MNTVYTDDGFAPKMHLRRRKSMVTLCLRELRGKIIPRPEPLRYVASCWGCEKAYRDLYNRS